MAKTERRYKTILQILFAGLFGLFASMGMAQDKNHEAFQNLSYHEGSSAAKKDEKIVMIDFYATWCGPCKLLDQTTWKDPRVQDLLREKAVALKVDAEKEVALAKKYSIHFYPTILFLKPDGREIKRLVGYRNPDDFLSETKDVFARKDQDLVAYVVMLIERLTKRNEEKPVEPKLERKSDVTGQKQENEEQIIYNRLDPTEYAAKALEAVKKAARDIDIEGVYQPGLIRDKLKEQFQELRFELFGEPLLLPEHEKFHRQGAQVVRDSTPAKLPEAAVLVNVCHGKQVLTHALVYFYGQKTDVFFNDETHFRNSLPLTEEERRQVAKELEPFYETAVDIRRGPERFYPFLRDDMRAFLDNPEDEMRLFVPLAAVKKHSNDELKRYVALRLDYVFHNWWLEFEGLKLPEPDSFCDLSNDTDLRPCMKKFEEVIAERKKVLEELGALDAEHFVATSPYLRRLIGEGLLYKELNEDGFKGLPKSAVLYVPSTGGGCSYYMHFCRIGKKLKMVGVSQP